MPPPTSVSTRLLIDYIGPMNRINDLIVVDSLTKWPKVVKYWRPMCEITINFL